MTTYLVIVEDNGTAFEHAFDGEPQLNLTFAVDDIVYKVTTRPQDEQTAQRTIHVRIA